MYDKYIELKNKNLDSVVMIKVGNFYHIYDKDIVIINYLLKYKIIDNKIGFPVSSLNKVIGKLKKEKINYYIDDANFYKFDDNKYQESYETSKSYYELSLEIDNIYNYLMNNIERKYIKRLITKIWEVIDEG